MVMLAGVDKRQFPNQKPSAVDTEVYMRLSGLVTIDVFAFDPLHHIVSLDLDCHTNVNVAREGVSLAGSRWLAIRLDPFLDKMLLFDFKLLKRLTVAFVMPWDSLRPIEWKPAGAFR
jgi:hypothetical protein